MKKNNLWRITWLIGVYSLLVSILILVIIYKVRWENKDLSPYLYFYNCNYNLCTSTIKQTDFYSKIKCDTLKTCPYIKDKIDNIVILSDGDKSWLYNYIDSKMIHNTYINYRYIGNNYFTFTTTDNLEGVMNEVGDTIVEGKYNYIDEYSFNYIVYKNDDLYGIINKLDEEKNIDPLYKDIAIINDTKFAGKDSATNKYKIFDYTNRVVENTQEYDYLYAYNNIILAVNDKKIDILDSNFKSQLLLKIDSYYACNTKSEIEKLSIYAIDNYLYFTAYKNDMEYYTYKYDTNNKKLLLL